MNVYKPLQKTGSEPEYKKYPPLKVSSIGTENTKKSTQMPFGSVILTGAGSSPNNLKSQGISYIIHAAMQPLGDRSNEANFIQNATLCIRNAMIVAEAHGLRSLATCFLGGEIYCSIEEVRPPLAEAIIRSALNQIADCPNLDRITFVDFSGDYYKNAFEKIKMESAYFATSNKARVTKGDLCKVKNPPADHNAPVIVNSENAQMGWGGGISGAIEKALGAEAAKEVDWQRKGLMKEFNELTEKTKYTCPQCNKEHNIKDKPLTAGGYCSLDCQRKSEVKKCAACSKIIDFNSDHCGDNEGKFYCSSACMNRDSKNGKTCAECSKSIGDTNKNFVYSGDTDKFFCSGECMLKYMKKRNKKETRNCDFCSKTINVAGGESIFFIAGKHFCSQECLNKYKRGGKSGKPDNLTSLRTSALSAIQTALNSEPKLATSDLSPEYQDYENKINDQLNSEKEINDLKEKVLVDIQAKRKSKQEAATLDEKINSAQTEDQKVNLFKDAGKKLGEQSSEQKEKLEQIKNELSTNPTQLRTAIQHEITAQMTAFEVKIENLNTEAKNQLENLKNEQNTTKIREIEKNLIQAVGKTGVNLKIKRLEAEITAVLRSKNQTKIKAIKAQLLQFISSPNSFYQAQKSRFQSLLSKLESGENQNQIPSNKPKFPLKILIPVLLIAVFIVSVLVFLFKKKRKKLR